jgi:hypothetical protein
MMSSHDHPSQDVAQQKSSNFALSIRQPWAELILSARKSIEIRSWTTDYRGPLWLHTGQKKDNELESHFGLSDLFYGGFVGQVTLSSVVRIDLDRWERWRSRHLVPGPAPSESYGWLLRDPVRLREPVAAPGELRLFLPDSETLTLLHQAIAWGDRRS